jgi:hypothetical protein
VTPLGSVTVAFDPRADFERRLLALIRNYLDECDEIYEHGYEIGDFMVIYQVYEEPGLDDSLKPWRGGPAAGRFQGVAFSTTTRNWWVDEAMVREVMRRIDAERSSPPEDESEDDADE